MTAPLPMGGQKIVSMADPTNAQDAATKNYVDTATLTLWSTGDVKLTFKGAADPGWLLFDDGTFGDVGSGASSSQSASNFILFALLFLNLNDTTAPLLTSGGGATTRAAQSNDFNVAWAAKCRLSLPRALGRALGISGNGLVGSGLTARPLGSFTGSETATLAAGNIPSLTSVNASQAISVASSANVMQNAAVISYVNAAGGGTFVLNANPTNTALTSTGNNSISVTYTNASPTPVSIMQPELFLNAMIKQ